MAIEMQNMKKYVGYDKQNWEQGQYEPQVRAVNCALKKISNLEYKNSYWPTYQEIAGNSNQIIILQGTGLGTSFLPPEDHVQGRSTKVMK